MLLRPLLLLTLATVVAWCADAAPDRKPETPPGQAVAADRRPAPPADERVETELAKQVAKAHAEYWAIVTDNMKAGLTHYGQKDLASNPRAKKQDDAQHRFLRLQHDALVEFFSILERRTRMTAQDPDSITFNKAMLTYPWEIGDTQQLPRTAGVMYARKHGLQWLLELSGGADKRP